MEHLSILKRIILAKRGKISGYWRFELPRGSLVLTVQTRRSERFCGRGKRFRRSTSDCTYVGQLTCTVCDPNTTTLLLKIELLGPSLQFYFKCVVTRFEIQR